MSMETTQIDLDDIQRLQKRGIRLAESLGEGKVFNEANPLAGVTKKQRHRTSKAADVLNIGSGTRCRHCGMLYFCWVDNCRTCKKPMEYNMGHIEGGV